MMTYEAHAASCDRKVRWTSVRAAKRALSKRQYRGGTYRCLACGFVHITSDRIRTHEVR